MSNLLVGEDGTPHFPLFWSLEPRRVSGFNFDQLSFDEKIDVAFLRNQAPLDCGFLLENEDLPARLRQSLDKMPPKEDVPRVLVNEKSIRRWLKKAGGDPGAQGSENQPPASTNERRKKFPVEQVIAREFNKMEDRSRVNKVGMRNVGKHLMTMGMQAAFFGYCFDSGLNSMDKELKDRALKIQELTEELKAIESSTQTISSLEQSLLDAKTKLTTVKNEKKAPEDLAEVVVQKKHLAEDKVKSDLDIDTLQKEISIQHARGFHKAIDHVKILNLAVDYEGVGVFKKIVDEKPVDESEDEEE
ncbi:hypothetical protein SESBI_25554 [Sesbania bispinosa]|nr:hypothetical protein SESBI_25554 [Sesbania bispinosa]